MQNEDPFVAFKTAEPAVEAKPEKKKRGRKVKAEKPKREVKVINPPNGSGVMVPLSALAAIRNLTDDEVKFTVAVAGGISELSKTAQRHVVAALAKIFS